MDDTWEMLLKYKALEDRIKDLRTQAWVSLAPSDDIENLLLEAEDELEKLKAWIELNYEAKRVD